ncbi:MAG: nucleotide sugar dehydrogenase [Candidatus Eisenbacteria bacterium]|nr:nucleotide sugar dehydrogenase [Candidatus Eisenbacteria bacterium]
MERICVIGTGYVGLVTGACLADFGNTVTCVDVDEEKIDSLRRGHIPFYEFSLEEVVRTNMREERLIFSSDLKDAVRSSRVIFSAVGTPSDSRGEADLSQVFDAARTIAEHANGYKLVVQKSTVPVGTGAKVKEVISRHLKRKISFDVASNPEFLREGSAVRDFLWADRVVIGTWTDKAEKLLSEIYRPLYLNETPMIKTSVETAELIKYASNAFLATKISFINEMANLCERAGADVKVLARAMGLDGRIGPKFLHAGPGFGGSCFPKDTRALDFFSRELGHPSKIVRATIEVNQRQRRLMVEKIADAAGGDVKGKQIGVLGLSFKPRTDDVRESVAVDIVRDLVRKGARVRAFDPVAVPNAKRILRKVEFGSDAYEVADGADALVIATEWNEFRMLDLGKIRRLMRAPLLVDCRNIYDPSAMERLGFAYVGVGRGEFLRRRTATSKSPAAGPAKRARKSTARRSKSQRAAG